MTRPAPRLPHAVLLRLAALVPGLVAGLLVTGPGAQAQALAEPGFALDGSKRVLAVMADGARIELGAVRFTPTGDGRTARVDLTLHTERFTDHFLSMREFKCLPGGTELSCHVPYPYANPGTVAPGQLAWLEHRLMFFYKKPADFGAKLWNGVYYQLRETPTGLVGTPQAIDLNHIAAPPARLDEPPYRPALREPMPADARWLRQILIE
ncbi:hypothetical protein [Aquabacterium sp. OR-4]|uniref:hypothetical protein n=1 Tax=Aquabacterium sp. OR-4 TaxID=2978127 RepID=UPI0021B2AAB0|nr:hypothetical protein [Aquabacterium sp. OR-4]MDT7838226.1 hypothetical protein [Aquabacterium sp. OR-4]